MFYDDKPFSVQEALTSWLPDMAGNLVGLVMNTQVLGTFMPELFDRFGFMRVDLRCGLNKDYL